MKIIKLLSLVLLLALPLAVQAQFTFTTNSGALTITGYTGSGGAVTIPATTNGYPVIGIGGFAFFLCSNLTSVTIPNSVTSIVDSAFGICYGLTNITVVAGNPDYSSVNGVLFDQTQVTLIQYPAGLGGSYSIPNSVTTIGGPAFDSCLGLTSVTIPNSVTSIGDAAFENCYSLTNIIVVAGNPHYSSVNGVLFDQAQATLIEYPGGLGGGYAIPNSVTSIGEYAFDFCNLSSVTIPNSVTTIGEQAFTGCFSLTNITVVTGDPDYSSVNGVLFDQAQATLIAYPGGLAGGYTIPNSVTTIGAEAFVFCLGLTSVTIPNSVTYIGNYAFEDCSILTSAYFLGNAPPDDGTVFFSDSATVYYLAGTTGWGSTFGGVPAVSMTPQSQFAFTTNSGAITIILYAGPAGAMIIPPTINGLPVTGIGFEDFFSYPGLTSVIIPNSVTNIGLQAFTGWVSLTNITVAAGDPDYSSVNGVLFDQAQATLIEYPGGLAGGYNIPNSVTSIGEDAFEGSESLTSVTIPNSVTSIGEDAFNNCISLRNVTIPTSVTNIGDSAFIDCSSLTNVTISDGVTTIGYGAFVDCLSLTSVTIPNSVTNIGDYAFCFCPNLTSAYFLGNAPPDDETVFGGDSATVYYLAGTTGWGATFGGVPAVLWNPQAQVPGLTVGQFGFSITGPTNATIVVEACTNLVNPVWLPVATNTLDNTGSGVFSDPQTGSYPVRYYRFSAQ